MNIRNNMEIFKLSNINRFPSLTCNVQCGKISGMQKPNIVTTTTFKMPDLAFAVDLVRRLLSGRPVSDLKIFTSRDLDFSMFGDKAPYLMGPIAQTTSLELTGNHTSLEIESFLNANWGNFMYLTAKGTFNSSGKSYDGLTIDAIHKKLILEK